MFVIQIFYRLPIYPSLWNAGDWATRGGLVKTDWSKAPFLACFCNFNAATSSSNFAAEEALDSNEEKKLQWVRNNYMIYDYCANEPSTQLHRLIDEFSISCYSNHSFLPSILFYDLHSFIVFQYKH